MKGPADSRLGRRRFKAFFAIGESKYIFKESSSGFVVSLPPGTSRDGIPRHITVPIDPETGEVRDIHMKSGRGSKLPRDWTIVPVDVLPGLTSWIRKNSDALDFASLRVLEGASYCVSVRRAIVSFRLAQPLIMGAVSILGRGLGLFSYRVEEDERETRAWLVVDPSRLLKHVRRLRPFKGLIESLIRTSFTRLVKRIAKLHLVKLSRMSEGDVSLVFPRERFKPMVVVKYERHLSVPMEHALQAVSDEITRLKISETMPALDTSSGRPVFMRFASRGSLPDD